jgi:hypothetical protein
MDLCAYLSVKHAFGRFYSLVCVHWAWQRCQRRSREGARERARAGEDCCGSRRLTYLRFFTAVQLPSMGAAAPRQPNCA